MAPEAHFVTGSDPKLVAQFLRNDDLPLGSHPMSHTTKYNLGENTRFRDATSPSVPTTSSLPSSGLRLGTLGQVGMAGEDHVAVQLGERLARGQVVLVNEEPGRHRRPQRAGPPPVLQVGPEVWFSPHETAGATALRNVLCDWAYLGGRFFPPVRLATMPPANSSQSRSVATPSTDGRPNRTRGSMTTGEASPAGRPAPAGSVDLSG